MLNIKFISVLLSLLMTLQMLPIARIGRMLSNNQWTEELPHCNEDETGEADKAKYTPSQPNEHNHLAALFSDCKARLEIQQSSVMPTNHSTDIVTPPPDFFA